MFSIQKVSNAAWKLLSSPRFTFRRSFNTTPFLSSSASSLSSRASSLNSPPLWKTPTQTQHDVTYLNQASLGLMSQGSMAAMLDFIQHVAAHGNTFLSDTEEAAYLEQLRQNGARLLGCQESDQVAIVSGASEILGQLPYYILGNAKNENTNNNHGTTTNNYDEIVMVDGDFPAVTRPWVLAAEAARRQQQQRSAKTKRKECRLAFVTNRPDQNLTESICQAVTKETKAVVVSYVQFATGCRVDPVMLRQATDAVGASLILDVTQAAGAVPLSFDEWKPDAMVTSGYKWLGGHGGVALAALSPKLALETTPLLPGWMGVADPFDLPARTARELDVANSAHRFTQSTMSYASVAGLTVSLQELLAIGITNVEGHSRALADHLLHNSATTNWEAFRRQDDPCASSHIVSLSNRDHDDVGEVETLVSRLRQANIVCGSRGGRLRVSLAGFNSQEDVERLVEHLLLD